MSEEIERQDSEIRLNPSGHKELVVKKKGKKDISTLNELATDLINVLEGIDFNGPMPSSNPGMKNSSNTPELVSSSGDMQRASDETISNMHISSEAPPSLDRAKAKPKFKVRTLGNESQNKYINGQLNSSSTHNESFTGTGAIAITPGVVPIDKYDDDNDDNNDDSTLESVMKKSVLKEWEPKFAGGGEYDPKDYQMPSPTGNGVAERKPKKDKVGSYDTDTTQTGEAWPRKHNDTVAMCDVDEDGVEHEPQGSHESTHGEPTDGHQSELGHDWPKQPKNSGNGVAEPFEGNRWSDGGTLSGGSGPNELDNSGRAQKMPSSGPIKGVNGPQLGQPQESWSPNRIGSLMEGSDTNLQQLFDLFARESDYVCLEDFQNLLNAYGNDSVIDESSIIQLMAANRELMFHEGRDASGRYWVGVPVSESKKPWEDGKDDDAEEDDAPKSKKPWEDGDDDCEAMEESRRPSKKRVLREFQVRTPDDEARPYGGMGPGNRRPMGDPDFGDDIMGDVTDDMDANSYDDMLGMSNEYDAANGPGPFGDDDSCPECGTNTAEDSCPECGTYLSSNEEDMFGAQEDPDFDYVDDTDEFYRGRGPSAFEPDPFDESVRVRSPQMIESLTKFIGSAKKIIERNSSEFSPAAIGEALQLSWGYYARGVNPNHAPSKVKSSIKRLMESYPSFNPLLENEAMDKMGGSGLASGKASNSSSYLAEKDNPGPDEMEEHGDPLGKKQKNTLDGTPIIKGTEKGMNGNGGYAKSVKENVTRLATHTKRRLLESARGIKGKYGVSFAILVNENGKVNRTNRRSTLAEALADVEEILQIHSHQDVVLECYFHQNNKQIGKATVPMIQVKPRGPMVSEGKAIFRFNRTAEKFADNLVAEGVTCRLGNHNWGCSVAAKVNYAVARQAFLAINESR